MIKALKFLVAAILSLCSIEAKSCECKLDVNCDIVDRVLVSGKVEKIIKEDGSLLKPEEVWWKAGDRILIYPPTLIADFKVLNSDDTTLLCETIKIEAGGGSNCDCGIYYGFAHYELHQVNRASGTLTSSVSTCTPKKYFSEKSAMYSHFSSRVEEKKNAKWSVFKRI